MAARFSVKEVEGARVVLDVNAVLHIDKRHGPLGKQDRSMASPEDLARIGYVIANYDEMKLTDRRAGGYRNETGEHSIQ